MIPRPSVPEPPTTRYNGSVNRSTLPASSDADGSAIAGRAFDTLRDDELLHLIALREEAALGVLYDRYIRLVYAVALRITGDRQTAEEVVQDTFQNVWQTAGTFQQRLSSGSTWLLSIARHRAIDATRSKRERARSREQILDQALSIADQSQPEREVEELLRRERVRAALGELPPNQRQAIELAYYGGFSRAEIAQSLGEPLGTIKTRMRLGLLKLQNLLHSEQHEELDRHDNAE
jgi:RNA polymerase sigma-70 factor, ECF subfamily